MKYLFSVLLALVIISVATAQPSTEVYLFELIQNAQGEWSLSNPVNISDNEGYDNQPSFSGDGELIYFASTREGQTDIVEYEIRSGSKRWISDTPGGEYSPKLSPDGKSITAVRLDPDGLQLLYSYALSDGTSEVLIPDLKIGYFSWIDDHRIVSFVLGDPQTLQVSDVSTGTSEILSGIPARSLHLIPETDAFSFIDVVSESEMTIKTVSINDFNEVRELTTLTDGHVDMTWAGASTLLRGVDSILYGYDVQGNNEWKVIANLDEFGLTNITRMAHYKGKLAIVVDGK